MYDLIDRLGDAKVITNFEASCGYFKILLVSQEQENTFFTTRMATYRYKLMNLGLWNAPYTFKRACYIILSGVLCQSFLLCLYEVIIFPSSVEEHVDHVDEVLSFLVAESTSILESDIS